MPREKRREALDRLREMTDAELSAELSKVREELFELRRKNVTRQLENVAAISECKRSIARILTLQTEREIAARAAAEEAANAAAGATRGATNVTG